MPYSINAVDPRPGWFETFGSTGLNTLSDLLLKAMLSGQLQRRPSAGQYTAPGGASTFISPAERVKGAPNTRLADLVSQQGKGTFTPTQYSGMRMQPDLSRQLQQQQLAKAPLERQKLEADIRNQQALTGYYGSLNGGVASDKLQQLEDDALAGDEDAVAAYRKLKALGIL